MGIIVPADKGGGYGIEKTVADGAVAETKVTRVLVEYGRQNRVAESVADDVIPVGGSGALCESSGTPAEAGVRVIGFAKACDNGRDRKSVRVSGGTELELEFLRGSERNGIAAVADVELGYDSRHALMFLLLDLFFGFLVFGFLGIWLLR